MCELCVELRVVLRGMAYLNTYVYYLSNFRLVSVGEVERGGVVGMTTKKGRSQNISDVGHSYEESQGKLVIGRKG